jgi:DNA-binding response OmpR family regulator
MRGYQVVVASTYQEADDFLETEKIDAVVTDFDLGYMSVAHGDKVVSLAKAKGLPVMLWSGLTRPDTGADFQTTKSDIDGLYNFLSSI